MIDRIKMAGVLLLAGLLIVLFYRLELVSSQRDAAQARLKTETQVSQTLADELDYQLTMIEKQQERFNQLRQALNAAAQAQREAEARYAESVKTLDQIRRQSEKNSSWADDPVPADYTEWLRKLTGTANNHTNSAD